MAGLIHIYCGDGKGKTTAAAGLALRAAGAGKKVVFAQFFKDGSSSEISLLGKIPPIQVLCCKTPYGFWKRMDNRTREAAAADYTALLQQALEASRDADLLVLDEILSACRHGAVPEPLLTAFLNSKPAKLEVVLTGREPSDGLLCLADYVTEMKKIRHPYDRGITARKGIEF